MLLFFALTLFTSASLLFLVQPMFAKMVLPLLGGTPQVWNTCMVFYQAVLLLGYLYAHFSTKWLGTRKQALVHLVLLALPWLVLPFGMATIAHQAGLPALVLPLGTDPSLAPPAGVHPALWLLVLLSVSVGLPFFVVSASAPMLQAWFAQTGHRAAKDPYFLYGASNLGSMLALMAYPFVIEPRLPLLSQSMVWAVGFGGLTALTFGCAVLLWRSKPQPVLATNGVTLPTAEMPAVEPLNGPVDAALAVPTAAQRLRWLGLSLVPSSLLLGVTTFISTDLAAVPLLWVIPLALYLLTFVLVFAQRPLVSHRAMLWLQPFLVVVVAVIYYKSMHDSLWLVILLHLAMFFVTTLVCHGELARTRPAASHLTEFYIWMSLGGVLGGLFNALVAPQIFSTVIEYPLMIAAACMMRPWPKRDPNPVASRWLDLIAPVWVFVLLWSLVKMTEHIRGLALPTHAEWWCSVGFLALSAGTVVMFRNRYAQFLAIVAAVLVAAVFGLQQGNAGDDWLWRLSRRASGDWREMAILAIGGLVAFSMLNRPVRFGLALGAVFLIGHVHFGSENGTIRVQRSFFGVLRVYEDDEERTLAHGSTTHGIQSLDPYWSRQPLSYYHHAGPLGKVIGNLLDPEKHQEIAVIGLGTGSTAAYADDFTDVRFTYFEIDPDVVALSVPPEGEEPYFTYIRDARDEGATVDIDLGDARLSLEKPEYDGRFDLITVDAFSSDAIPAHLLTREAMNLYFQKLKPDGVLMVHISNRHLDLEPVVGNLAADLGLVARVNDDDDERQPGQYSSTWVVVVRNEARLGPLAKSKQWKSIPWDEEAGIWTDDFSNILSVSRAYQHFRGWLREKLHP